MKAKLSATPENYNTDHMQHTCMRTPVRTNTDTKEENKKHLYAFYELKGSLK